jgi:hypothetical protein
MSLISDLADKADAARKALMAKTESSNTGTLAGLKALLQKKQQTQQGPPTTPDDVQQPVNNGAN